VLEPALYQTLNASREFVFANEVSLVTENLAIQELQEIKLDQDGAVLMETLTILLSITPDTTSKETAVTFSPEKELKLKSKLEMDIAEEIMWEDLHALSELLLSSELILLSI